MRNQILALALGLLVAAPAFAAGHGKHAVVAKKAVVAEGGEKPAEAKPAEGAKTTKKASKKTTKAEKPAEKPAEAAPAK